MEAAYIEALNEGLLQKRSDGRIRDFRLLREAERLNRAAKNEIDEPSEPVATARTTIPPPSWRPR